MFLGADRQEAVSRLLAAWKEVGETYSPRLVSIYGEPGFGKTRIVQEFYRQVMIEHNSSGFWPAAIRDNDEADLGSRLGNARKSVRPTGFTPPAGAEPEMLWLGTVLPDGEGLPFDSGLDDVIDQLTAILSSMIRQRDLTRAAGRLLYKLIGLLPFDPTFQHLLDSLDAGIEVWNSARIFRMDRDGREIAPQAGLDEKLAAFYRTVVGLWGNDGLDGPPVVFVCEDAHAAQAATLALIEQILRSRKLPFLIILCSQSQALQTSPMSSLVESVGSAALAIEVSRLDETDLQVLVANILPRTVRPVVAALAAKADGNPYHAQLLLLSLRDRTSDGHLDITVAEIDEIPSSFEAILARLWEGLSSDDQRTLSAFATIGQQAPHRIDDAIRNLLSLPEARSGWLRQQRESRAFLEIARWELVHSRIPLKFSSEIRSRIVATGIETMREMLTTRDLATESSELTAAVRDCVVQLASEALTLNVRPLDSTLAREVLSAATSLRWGLQYKDAALLATRSMQLAQAGEDSESLAATKVFLEASRLKTLCARLIHGKGSTAAIDSAEECLQLALSHPNLKIEVARAWLTVSRANRTGSVADGYLERSKDALDEAQRLWESSAMDDDFARRDLQAATYPFVSRTGRRMEAAELARDTGELAAKLYGPDHFFVIEAESDYAYYMLRIDRQIGVEAYRGVHTRRLAVWGSETHPSVMNAKKNLSSALLRLRTEAAFEESMGFADWLVRNQSEHFGARAMSPSVSKGVAAASRVGLSRYRPEMASELIAEALDLAEIAYSDERKLRPTRSLWPVREHLAEARAASGNVDALQTYGDILQERAAEYMAPERRAELRWSAERYELLLKDFGRDIEATEVRRRFRLSEPDKDVLGSD